MRSTLFFLFIFYYFVNVTTVASSPVRFATDSYNNSTITIHIITHSHDDVGWLKTVDEYYVNDVKNIITTSVAALRIDPTRKFSIVEQAYFVRWWREQNDSTKQVVRDLVSNGQLEFNLGSYAMADEATPTYTDIINQFSLGHRFINKEVGGNARPTVGWSVDPFGHSSATPSIWADMGLSAMGGNRINTYEKDERKKNKQLEFVWRGSKSLGSENDMFVTLLENHYCTPIDSIGKFIDNSYLNADTRLPTYGVNVGSIAEDVVNYAKNVISIKRHNHVLIPFGCDFQHENAFQSFGQMDKVIDYINNNSSFNAKAQYSFLSDYVKAVHELDLTWDVMEGRDFYPYIDKESAYWTGYFTSRTILKGDVRRTSSVLRAVETMVSLTVNATNMAEAEAIQEKVMVLREALGVVQHHDGVSGTEKQHVSDDYAKMMDQGRKVVAPVESVLLSRIVGSSSDLDVSGDSSVLSSITSTQFVSTIVFNSLGWPRHEFVKIPVNRTDLVVKRFDDISKSFVLVQSQINPSPQLAPLNATSHNLYFLVDVPALGYSTYYIFESPSEANVGKSKSVIASSSIPISITNEFYSVNFDSSSHHISSVINNVDKMSLVLDVSLAQYFPAAGSSEQNSGAYVFRPYQDNRVDVDKSKKVSRNYMISFPEGSPVVVLHSAHGQLYPDTFAVTTNLVSATQFAANIDRFDGNGWSQHLTLDFIALDLSNQHPSSAQTNLPMDTIIGSVKVGPSSQPSQTVSILFGKVLANIPRIVASTRLGTAGDLIFSVATVSASKTDAKFVISCVSGGSWNDSVYIDYIVLPNDNDSGSYTRAQTVNVKDGSKGVTQVTATVDEFPIYSPCVIATARFTSPSAGSTVAPIVSIASSQYGKVLFNICVRSFGDSGSCGPLPSLVIDFIIFERPVIEFPVPTSVEASKTPVSSVVITGPFIQEVHTKFASNVETIVRIISDKMESANSLPSSFAKVDFAVQISPQDQFRELVARFSTDFPTIHFQSDDNGLEVLNRTYAADSQERIAGNMYPFVSRASISNNSTQLTLVSDRSHSVGMHIAGELEVMLHRRTMMDDGYGVGEILNEVDSTDPSFNIIVANPSNAIRYSRHHAVSEATPPRLYFGIVKASAGEREFTMAARSFTSKQSDSYLKASLPENIHLLGLETSPTVLSGVSTENNSTFPTVLRLQHLFDVDETVGLSDPVCLDLQSMFSYFDVDNIIETNLSGTVPKANVNRLKWKTEPTKRMLKLEELRNLSKNCDSILMSPRELRTFVLNY